MNKDAFYNWLKTKSLSEKTVKNYMRGLKYIDEKFGYLLSNDLNSVYEVIDANDLNVILNDDNFIEYDKKGNRMCSSGLKKYLEFRNELKVQEINEQNFKIWLQNNSTLNSKTISTYLSNIRSLKNKLKHLNMDKEWDLYQIVNNDEVEKILKDSIFIEFDRDVNHSCSAAIKYYQKYLSYINNNIDEKYFSLDAKFLIEFIFNYIRLKGFNYSLTNIKNLYLSLRSKPFVIISGISGTGKTKIVQLFAESIGATEENGQFMLVPVRPDWSDGSELLGYTDIKGDFVEGQLTKLIHHAIDYPERPHFLLLDEMNLARVEYYFSDILSIMESRKMEEGEFTSSKLELADGVDIYLPGNVYIIGTVNMDETTHPFSKKVLDRANTIEFNEIELNNFSFLQEQEMVEPIHVANESLQANYIQLQSMYGQHKDLVHKVSKQLETLNEYLKEIHAQVGYRVRDEICFYMAHNAEGGMLLTEDEAFDFCLMQKILPRIAGSGTRVETLLQNLERFMEKRALPRSKQKLAQMQERLSHDEFTSFWIA